MNTEQRFNHWLGQRQNLLVKLCAIHQSSSQKFTFPSMKKRDDLFEVMLDYICAGHFEVFQHILARLELNSNIDKKLTQTTLSDIQTSTDLCVQLNDKYQHLKKPDKQEWRKDISQLAESLAERFELEDFLIEKSFEASNFTSQSA